jgi:inositol transporter-like SP family MFS transporter
MLVFLAIHCVVGIILAPNTLGKSLKQIEEERFGTEVKQKRKIV